MQQLHDQLKQERRSKSDGRTEKRKVPEIPFIRPFDIAWMRGKLPESFTTSPRSFDVDVFLFQLSAMEALVLEAEQRKQKTAAFERKPFSEDSVAPVADSGERKGQDETEEHHTSSQQRPPPHKYADADWWDTNFYTKRSSIRLAVPMQPYTCTIRGWNTSYVHLRLLLLHQVAATGPNSQGDAQDFGGWQVLQAERGGEECRWQVCNE